MFFIASKVLKFLIVPLNWLLLILLLAIITKSSIKRKRYLISSFVFIVLFTSPLLLALFMGVWQVPAVPNNNQSYEAAIVLGGLSSYDEQHDRIQFLRGADRLFQAIDLYKEGKVKKIIFTGGSGYVLKPEQKEGVLLKPYVLKLGIAEKDFIIESESRNTYENAVFTKVLIDSLGVEGRLLLITSGFHMRRSIACFHQQDLIVEPYSTDIYKTSDTYKASTNWFALFTPSIDVIANWTNMIHEVIGFVVYKVVGYA